MIEGMGKRRDATRRIALGIPWAEAHGYYRVVAPRLRQIG
jgi:hypothetical protein